MIGEDEMEPQAGVRPSIAAPRSRTGWLRAGQPSRARVPVVGTLWFPQWKSLAVVLPPQVTPGTWLWDICNEAALGQE